MMPAANIKKRLQSGSHKAPLPWKRHGKRRIEFRAKGHGGLEYAITQEGPSFMLTLASPEGTWEDLGSNGSYKTLMAVAQNHFQKFGQEQEAPGASP